jgi:hypothetical protein
MQQLLCMKFYYILGSDLLPYLREFESVKSSILESMVAIFACYIGPEDNLILGWNMFSIMFF